MLASASVAAVTSAAEVLPRSLGFYLVTMLVGFVIGIWGHAAKSRVAVAIGVALIFLATVILPLALNVFEDTPPAPPNIRSPGE